MKIQDSNKILTKFCGVGLAEKWSREKQTANDDK